MPFTLYIAADLYQNKVNLEIEFPALPTLSELLSVSQNTFTSEASVLRPAGAALQSIVVQKLQVYVDDQGWRDLISPTQLTEWAQLYVFQADPSLTDNQAQILPARRPSRPVQFPTAGPASPGTPLSPVIARRASPTRNTSPPRAGATPLAGSSASVARSPVPTAAVPTSVGRSVSPRRGGASAVVATTPASSSSAAAIASSQSNLAPVPNENSTQSEKIRFIFDEMDLNGNRVIEIEEFRQVLRALNVDFSPATVTDLFRKADHDRDGVLSPAEFSSFFSGYTTLLDALFFRQCDVIKARNFHKEMTEEKAALDACRDRKGHAQSMSLESARLVEQQQQKLQLLEGEKQQKLSKERDIKAYLQEGEADLDQAKREVHTREVEFAQARANEDQRKNMLNDQRLRVQDSERDLSVESNALAAAQDKERQLQQLLAEAQRAVEHARNQVNQAQTNVNANREAEAAAFQNVADAGKEVSWAQDRLATSERESLLKQERQKELRSVLDEHQMELSRLIVKLDEEVRDTEACRERERSNVALAADAEAACVQQEQRLLRKDQEIVDFNKRRAAMEQQERPLLEQEVRLREQRDSLDEKETALRRDAGSHFGGPVSVRGTQGLRSVSPTRRPGL